MKRSSDLALGSWQFGPSHGFWIGGTIEASRLTIRAAYKAGIRHFDTAPAYGNGLAEQLLGSALSGKSVHIDTKFMPKKKPFLVEQDVQKSLDRLKTPSINTLYLHWPSSSVELRPIVEAAARLIEQGKVHHLGLSNAPLSLVQAMQDLPITFLQVPCSLLWTRGLEEYKQYAEKQGISLVGYSPWVLACSVASIPRGPTTAEGIFMSTKIQPTRYSTNCWNCSLSLQKRKQ